MFTWSKSKLILMYLTTRSVRFEFEYTPQRINGIILNGSLGLKPHLSYRIMSQYFVGLIFRNNELIPRGIFRYLIQNSARFVFWPDTTPTHLVAQQYDLLSDRSDIVVNMTRLARSKPCEQLQRQLDKIKVPTLVIHGEKDPVVPAKHGLSIHQNLLS